MRVAALYNIHANFPALEAVLEHVCLENVDQIVVGGDVFPGPMPREVISRLNSLDRPVRFIQGNGDREVLARLNGTESSWYRNAPDPWREPVRWTGEQLSAEHREQIARWPATCQMEIPHLGRVLFCHATPMNDTDVFTRRTPEERLTSMFDGLDAAVVICGHTHMQFDRMVGGVRVLNAGSVGMPIGKPGAYWLLLGPDVKFMHTTFDFSNAACEIRDTKYPYAEDFANHSILVPPSESEMLEKYSRLES